MDEEKVMLTTIDNPYNPFTNFEQWFSYDVENGYNSCALLDRFADTSDELTDEENSLIVQTAINEIIRYDLRNIYAKISKNDKAPLNG